MIIDECYALPVTDHRWVDTAEALAELSDALAATRELALDTESNSMFAYRERMCLIQLHLIGRSPPIYAIDPLAFDGTQATDPLVTWFDTGREVLLHGGEYDVAVLKRELGTAPANLFDTQIAASLLGMAKTGYANLCRDLLGVAVTKEHQQFDWGRRPVPAGPRRYALDDVRHLPALAAVLRERVRAADIAEEVAIACRAVAESPPHEGMSAAQQFWRVAGGARLTSEQRGRLAALLEWREREAQRRDQPPGRLVPKRALIALARAAPTSAGELKRFGLSRRLLANRSESLLSALASTAEVPARVVGRRPDSAVERRKNRLKAWRDEEAARRGVTTQVVLPTRALDALAWGERDLASVPQLGDKRIRLYGDTLLDLTR